MATPALMITTGSNEAGRLSAGALVPSAESVSLEEIQGRVAKVAESADALLSELRTAIPALTGDARTFLGNLNQISGAQNQKRIEQILGSLNTVLERESPKIAQITDQISDLAKHADSVVGSVEPVVQHLDQAVATSTALLAQFVNRSRRTSPNYKTRSKPLTAPWQMSKISWAPMKRRLEKPSAICVPPRKMSAP